MYITRTYAGILILQLDNENLEMLLAYSIKMLMKLWALTKYSIENCKFDLANFDTTPLIKLAT